MTDDPGSAVPGEEPEPSFGDLMNSFSLDSGHPRRRRKNRSEDAPPAESPSPPDGAGSPAEPNPSPVPAAFDADSGDPAALVRPYTWTGGRTRSSLDLRLETLVSSSEDALAHRQELGLEHRAVAGLCRHPHSVAEVAAKLAVPLGVARVLLSDMAEQHLVVVHETGGGHDVQDGDEQAAHYSVMERVLSGLRRL
jgi:hypothetical protein